MANTGKLGFRVLPSPPRIRPDLLERFRGLASPNLAAGIKAVLAQSFSRTFFRNAINNGLIPVQCDTSHTSEGDRLSVRLDGGRIGVTNHSSGRSVSGAPLPGIMLTILESGGIVAYIRAHGSWPAAER